MRKFNPVAELFPLMQGPPFDALVADIRAHGLRDPVVVDNDGAILDGRNRARACAALGIDPPHRVWDGIGTPLQYVVSTNFYRRHLTKKQRAFVAARLVTTDGKGRNASNEAFVSEADAAQAFDVGRSAVQSARIIVKHCDPDTIATVEHGPGSLRETAIAVRSSKRRNEPAPAAVVKHRSTRDPNERAKRIKQLRAFAAEGYSSRQMAKTLGVSEDWCRKWIRAEKIKCPGDDAIAGTRRIRSDTVLENVVFAVEHIATGTDLIDWDEIDPQSMKPRIDRMKEGRNQLNAFIRTCEQHMSKGRTNEEYNNGQDRGNSADRQTLHGRNRQHADAARRRYPKAV